mgnify:CR=1 FL=1
MRTSVRSSAAALSLATMATAALDKPVINPTFPGGGLDSLAPGLMDSLQIKANTWKAWDNGFIAQDCKTLAEGNNVSPMDITTFEIKYDDCDDPWVMCRHKDAPLTEQNIVDMLGRLPVRFRQYVRHMLFLAGNKGAGSNGDNVVMNGDLELSVFIHEIGHSYDSHGMPQESFSTTQTWLDAYNADSAVTDAYGQSSQAENFAQQTVVALFDKYVQGGVAGINPSAQSIFNQYNTILTESGDKLNTDGSCTSRLENSPPVAQSFSARMRPASQAPNVALSPKTKVIKSIPMSEEMEIVQQDAKGKVTKKVVKLNV